MGATFVVAVLAPSAEAGHRFHDGLATGQTGDDALSQVVDLEPHGDEHRTAVGFIGRPAGEVDIRIDGTSVNDPGTNMPLIRPTADFIGAMQIRTVGQPADVGPYAGGMLNLLTPSGTNIPRGELRLTALPRRRRPLLGVQGVAALRGPFVKDRLFWAAGAMARRGPKTQVQATGRVDAYVGPRHRVWSTAFVAPTFAGRSRDNAVVATAGYNGRIARDRLEVDTRVGFVQGKNGDRRSRRLGAAAALTHYFNGLGSHQLRYGAEAEHTRANDRTAQNYAAFVRDTWQLLDNLYVMPGVRWDAQDVGDVSGRRIAFVADNVAPRVAAAYDWTGEGGSRLAVSYGWTFQQLPLQLFDEATARSEKLRGQYDREVATTYRHEIVENVVLGVSWVHRSLQRATLAVDEQVLNPRVSPTRNTDAFTFDAQKRMGDNWLFVASYTYARELGTYDGFGVPVPTLPELARNRFGPLRTSAPHRLKLDGFYGFNFDQAGNVWLGAGVRVASGAPISLTARSVVDDAASVFVLPRGAGGRTPTTAQLNLHVQYTYPLSSGLVLAVGARVYNATHARPTVAVDERYSNQTTRAVAGGDLVDLKHAKVHSRFSPTEFFRPAIVAPGPDFGRARAFQEPVEAQVDVQLLF